MNIKPLAPLSRFLVVLLKINVFILVVAVITDLYTWYEYSHLAPGLDPREALLTCDMVNLGVIIIQIPFAIFLGIAFLRWIHRANTNLHALSSESMTFTPGWSVGWYFVPFLNLYKPYQAMKEIWRVASRAVPHGDDDPVIGWWWFLWILSNFVARIAMKMGLKAESAASYTNSALADFVSDGLHIPLNIIAIMLVTRIAKAYSENYSELPAAPPVMS